VTVEAASSSILIMASPPSVSLESSVSVGDVGWGLFSSYTIVSPVMVREGAIGAERRKKEKDENNF
jgi:hypothetical protein